MATTSRGPSERRTALQKEADLYASLDLRPFYSPGESLRESVLNSSLGLHLFYAKMWLEGLLVSGCFVAGLVMLIVVLETPDLGADPFCCYPRTISPGTLGRCDDPTADILSTPGRHECPSRSEKWQNLLALSLYLLAISRILIYAFDLWFQKVANSEMMTLRGQKPFVPGTNSFLLISTWQWRLCTWSPGAIILGSHNYILAKHWLQKLHIWTGAIAIVFTLFFRYIALPLDNAWSCYGYKDAADTNLGLCTDPNAKAHTLGTDPFKHTPVFWWTLGLMAFFYLIFLTCFYYSISNIRTFFVSRVEAYRKHLSLTSA